MSDLINWITFFRNLIWSSLVGILVPYLLNFYIDPNELVLNYQMMLTNGLIFVGIYTVFGLFRKETIVRFLIGCGYIGVVIYFFTVGHTIYTLYLPHCGFCQLCLDGGLEGINFSLKYSYIYVGIVVVALKGVGIFRHLIKPL